MKLCSKLLAIAIVTAASALISCAGPSTYSYQNVTLTLTPYMVCNGCFTGNFTYLTNPAGAGGVTGAIEMPFGGSSGGCIEIKANVTNAPVNPTWTIVPTPNASVPSQPTGTSYAPGLPNPNVGTLSSPSGSTNYYCEPNSIPIYTGTALAQAQAAGLPMGNTEVVVTNPADPNDPTKVVSASLVFAFEVTGPPGGNNGSPPLVAGFYGLTVPTNVTVPLGGTYQFNGYTAGANGFDPCSGGKGGGTSGLPAYGVTYLVNNTQGGLGTGPGQFGTISATGLYTAPAAYPSTTVHSANVTVASLACPTIISGAVTVNFP